MFNNRLTRVLNNLTEIEVKDCPDYRRVIISKKVLLMRIRPMFRVMKIQEHRGIILQLLLNNLKENRTIEEIPGVGFNEK